MALFQINGGSTNLIKPTEFKLEKELQQLIEKNLQTLFNCRFVATEFSTGKVHGGRIDTLAISEDDNPVIVEYKIIASSDLLNQSLYYLSWIKDHKGDFEVAVTKQLGNNITVDWSDIRVICIAPEYKKYDLHAAQMLGTNIELWQFKLYINGVLHLEEVLRKSDFSELKTTENGKNPIMVEAGKKAAATRANSTYTIDKHRAILSVGFLDIFDSLRDFIINLDNSIEETPKKQYIAYKTSQNFVCITTHKTKLSLYLKINPMDINPMPVQARDVTNIGHFSTGDLEFTIKDKSDFEIAKNFIKQSFENIGG